MYRGRQQRTYRQTLTNMYYTSTSGLPGFPREETNRQTFKMYIISVYLSVYFIYLSINWQHCSLLILMAKRSLTEHYSRLILGWTTDGFYVDFIETLQT